MSTSIAGLIVMNMDIPLVSADRKWRDLLELSIGYGLILVVIWTVNPWQRWIYYLALCWIGLVTMLAADHRKEMGFQITGFRDSLWVVGVALLMAAGGIAVASRFETLHYPRGIVSFIDRFAGYALWAFMQQFLLQDFFLLRLLRLTSDRKRAVILAAGLFMLAHLPSPILTVTTFLWGYAACRLFLRYRNIYTLAIAHAIFGICMVITIPGPVDHNMRVGYGYLSYHAEHRILEHFSHR